MGRPHLPGCPGGSGPAARPGCGSVPSTSWPSEWLLWGRLQAPPLKTGGRYAAPWARPVSSRAWVSLHPVRHTTGSTGARGPTPSAHRADSRGRWRGAGTLPSAVTAADGVSARGAVGGSEASGRSPQSPPRPPGRGPRGRARAGGWAPGASGGAVVWAAGPERSAVPQATPTGRARC